MERILIIEDEPDIQELLRNYLEEEGIGMRRMKQTTESVFIFPKKKRTIR